MRYPELESKYKLDTLVRQNEHHVQGKRLGRHIEHDSLSRNFRVESPRGDDSFKSVIWERKGEVFDQGELGSCTGNAMGALLMTGPFYSAKRTITQIECIQLYARATRYDRFPGEYPPDDTGSSGLAVMRAAKFFGYINGYHHAFTVQAAIKALQRGPVISGFDWYDSFDNPINGLIQIAPNAMIRGGHEVCAYGIDIVRDDDDEIDEHQTKVRFWNSWGRDYGVNGTFLMTLSTWRILMRNRGDVTVPVL